DAAVGDAHACRVLEDAVAGDRRRAAVDVDADGEAGDGSVVVLNRGGGEAGWSGSRGVGDPDTRAGCPPPGDDVVIGRGRAANGDGDLLRAAGVGRVGADALDVDAADEAGDGVAADVGQVAARVAFAERRGVVRQEDAGAGARAGDCAARRDEL